MDSILEQYITNGQWNDIIEYAKEAKDKANYNEQIAVADWKARQMLGMPEHKMLEALREGMLCNPFYYELYVCLADMKLNINNNPNQAYICLEQALFYCDNSEDKEQILSMMLELDAHVNPTSIIIASYNCCEMMKDCINTIRTYTPPNSYEIIVVDNASTDGIAEWLSTQNDIKVIMNKENKGFGAASNQGFAVAKPENDIFFLNNDTIVTANAIFWLKMGLYENNTIGATSCMSNSVSNDQIINVSFKNNAEVLSFGKANNIVSLNPYEEKITLVGFALLVKRNVINRIGVFDEIYGIGNYEDVDFSIRILNEGYKLILCHNSFIFHYGSQGFEQLSTTYLDHMLKNRELFINKWGFNISYYSSSRNEILKLIEDFPSSKEMNVLEIGCGAGATLAKIKYLWPNSKTYGVEISDKVAKLADNYSEVIVGDIENLTLPYDKETFDVIICGDVLEHLRDPEATLKNMYGLLKRGGSLLASIPNVMHSSVLYPLLRGHWDYKDSGILDRTHLKFFTLKSIYEMFANVNLNIELIYKTESTEDYPESNPELMEHLRAIMTEDAFNQIFAYQYIIKSVK